MPECLTSADRHHRGRRGRGGSIVPFDFAQGTPSVSRGVKTSGILPPCPPRPPWWESLGHIPNIPRPLLMAGPCVLTAALALAQTAVPRLPPALPNPPAASLQAPLDPGYAALIATCSTPPPA